MRKPELVDPFTLPGAPDLLSPGRRLLGVAFQDHYLVAIPAQEKSSTKADDPSADNHNPGDGDPPPLPAGDPRSICSATLPRQVARGHSEVAAREVFQAAVDLNGDHAVAGTQPLRDRQRCDEVGAGGWSGEYPLGPGGPAGHLERLGFRDGYHFVVVGWVKERRAAADAAALDVMRSSRSAGQDSGLGRFDHDAVESGQGRGQRPADPQEAASGADVAAERADRRRPGQLIKQFGAEPAVAVDHVSVIELVGGERTG